MAQFRKKPVVIEAITFEELVQYGKDNGANIVNDMPWSFKYNGHPITHENNECYLIPTLEGTLNFTLQDVLITGVKGEIYPCKKDIFEATYDLVEQNVDDSKDLAQIQPTLGMNRVQASFNPSNNPRVDEIKNASAILIDLCESMRLDEGCSGEKHRSISLAQTAYEEAAMHAVKANFK